MATLTIEKKKKADTTTPKHHPATVTPTNPEKKSGPAPAPHKTGAPPHPATAPPNRFGSSRLARAKPVNNRLFTPRDLPDKGIYFHPNYLRKLINAGKFPKPIRLSVRKIAWRESDLDAWIDSKVEAA